ncbi:uncharacterized protein LOC127264293 isoform X2 [Andrographis paniculata]|uniref:uncharacterized protein LOC127264293 isoform X2 n=1 Tax=Andrographis paniculata TaxID=175694 RepID=UPI0021E8127D|nr:uncharacterized protein LOC127264293 isoform X2 [Andrographis paniculata]
MVSDEETEGPRYTEWDENMDMGTNDLDVGMKFSNREKFNEDLKEWVVRKGWDLKYPKKEKHVVAATCKKGCGWFIRASSIMRETTFQIKILKGRHTCAHMTTNSQADFRWSVKIAYPMIPKPPVPKLWLMRSYQNSHESLTP